MAEPVLTADEIIVLKRVAAERKAKDEEEVQRRLKEERNYQEHKARLPKEVKVGDVIHEHIPGGLYVYPDREYVIRGKYPGVPPGWIWTSTYVNGIKQPIPNQRVAHIVNEWLKTLP